ncbi:MAG: AI-2E family transporter [Tissierellaceae bacterium]|jgi:predicted PurR-regulated permease PerM|nr:AI-2E family transporter [Tissierellia bacterium]
MIISRVPDFVIKAIFILIMVFLTTAIYYLVNIGNNYIDGRKRINLSNKKLIIIMLIAIIFYIFTMILRKFPFISDIIATIIGSIIIAYALNPIINSFERRNIKRFYGVIIVYLSIVAMFFILSVLVIPSSGKEIRRFVSNLPIYFEQISDIMDGFYTKYYSTLGGLPPMFQGIENIVMENLVKLEGIIIDSMTKFVGGVLSMASKLVNIVLTPILVLYFLVDKAYFKELLIKLIPNKYREDTLQLASIIDTSLKQFIKGRLIMSLYAGVMTTILLLVLGIEFPFVIGFITGVADIVPYIGPFLGYVPAVFFASFSGIMKVIWVSIFWVLIQWTENNIVAPKIIGENMGMHPMVILLSIIIGGGVFGVFGMILSVPIVAITKITTQYILDKRRKT